MYQFFYLRSMAKLAYGSALFAELQSIDGVEPVIGPALVACLVRLLWQSLAPPSETTNIANNDKSLNQPTVWLISLYTASLHSQMRLRRLCHASPCRGPTRTQPKWANQLCPPNNIVGGVYTDVAAVDRAKHSISCGATRAYEAHRLLMLGRFVGTVNPSCLSSSLGTSKKTIEATLSSKTVYQRSQVKLSLAKLIKAILSILPQTQNCRPQMRAHKTNGVYQLI